MRNSIILLKNEDSLTKKRRNIDFFKLKFYFFLRNFIIILLRLVIKN
jgi:hypothetical protein